MKKDKKPYNPAAYPLFGIRLSPHPLQFIVMSHLRVQFVLHLFKEVGATVAFPAFDVRIEAVAVFGGWCCNSISAKANATIICLASLPP